MLFGDDWFRSQEGMQQDDHASSLMFSLDIHPIFKLIGADLYIIVNRWYAGDGIFGKIDQVKHDLDIIAEYGANISSGRQPTKMKAFCPAQYPLLL